MLFSKYVKAIIYKTIIYNKKKIKISIEPSLKIKTLKQFSSKIFYLHFHFEYYIYLIIYSFGCEDMAKAKACNVQGIL